jgi:ribosomal protein S18 acetylase RimI-like enzyme
MGRWSGSQLTYFKRFRMEIDIAGRDLVQPLLPVGYKLRRWHDALLDAHARTKYLCFRGEIDANVFPCLSDQEGCFRLMREIRAKPGFLPEATWLAARQRFANSKIEYVGTVQGVQDASKVGLIQNLGIVPAHRGLGLGATLLVRALAGFQQAGAERVCLEVTSLNSSAIRLYERLGFRRVKTVYKAVEVAYA